MGFSRRVLLVQLPIPPVGHDAVEGNVPLAPAHLILFARRQGLEDVCSLQLFPPSLADRAGDQAIVAAILARQPWLVGFTCYLWNVERSLWMAQRLKEQRPDLIVVLGGPEITLDNPGVLHHPAVDYAVLGEGEKTFAELLTALTAGQTPADIPGLWHAALREPFTPRRPLPCLDAVLSPYREGILDVAEEGRVWLETVRGCRFRCKYCSYPKNNETLRYASPETILADLRHADERCAAEVVLLDPTLNQHPDFHAFLRLLRRGNAGGRLAFSGELRAEGIDAATARLLKEANFYEVEIGLQSVEPQAWRLMGRPTNLAAFERGVKAILAEGIKARVDLIVGLPGDTPDSVRRGIDFLQRTKAYSEVQVFNLAILPGTDFRREAARLGLRFQSWPPYYVLNTPALDIEQMWRLMEEAQQAFGVVFDALPLPRVAFSDAGGEASGVCRIDLDNRDALKAAIPPHPSLAFSLWFRSADFHRRRREAAACVARLLADNPHTTLQVILEPVGDPRRLTIETLELLLQTCYETTSYLDRYYSLHPGRLLGAKRLVVLIPRGSPLSEEDAWWSEAAELADLLRLGETP